MALPAGRYGVTKNQLLKIKKLPMNTIKLIEDLYEKYSLLGSAAFKNSTSVVTESSDLVESGAVYTALQSKMSYADNGVLGAKNILPPDNIHLFMPSSSTVGSTVALQSSSTVESYVAELNPNTDYIISSVGGNRNIVGLTNTYPVLNGNVYVAANESTNTPVRFNSGNYKYAIFYLHNTSHTLDEIKPMLRLATDTDPTYQPHAETNRELTVNKADNSVIGTVEDGTNPTKSYAVDEFMVRDGAFCQVTAPVTTSSTWTEGSNYTKKSIAEVLQSLMS